MLYSWEREKVFSSAVILWLKISQKKQFRRGKDSFFPPTDCLVSFLVIDVDYFENT